MIVIRGDSGKRVYRVTFYDDAQKRLHGIYIVQRDDDGNLEYIVVADSALWINDRWDVFGAKVYKMQNNSNNNINILINNFNFYCNKNINSNSQKEEQNDNCEMTGYLLEFSTNKMFIIRWLIGFIYFVFKCIFFIYSNNKNTNNDNIINTKILKLVQKISMLIFPLSLFFYDLNNNISFSKINLNHSYDKTVSFYIMNEKRFSPIDYVEGLIPTLFTFLISFDYNNIDKIINNYVVKTKKLNKLV